MHTLLPKLQVSRPETQCLVARHAALEASCRERSPAETYVKLSREFAEIDAGRGGGQVLPRCETEIDGSTSLIADPATDAEMRADRRSGEAPEVEARRAMLEQQLRLALFPKDAMDEHNVILEIRAGTGGDEAALFAGDLFRMYERYAAKQGWKIEIVTASEGANGRLQGNRRRDPRARRLRQAEIRIRACIASSACPIPKRPAASTPRPQRSPCCRWLEDVDVEINDSDLRIDTLRSGGAGGQHVNKTESAVRITHIPSGHRGGDAGRALPAPQPRQGDGGAARHGSTTASGQKRDAARAAERRGQVGSGDRSERIRTYNFPQGRVSDHRINLTLYKLPQMMEGEALGEIIDALVAEHQASTARRRGD